MHCNCFPPHCLIEKVLVMATKGGDIHDQEMETVSDQDFATASRSKEISEEEFMIDFEHRFKSKKKDKMILPQSDVVRIMRKVLPANAKIESDVKETVQVCVSDFISLVTSEANQRCHSEKRKTIRAEDVVWGMENLGFENYVQPLRLYLQKLRDEMKE